MFFLPIRSSCAATTQISPYRFENICNRRKYLIFRSFGNPVFPLFSTVSPQIFPCFQQLFPQCYPHYPIFSAFKRERSPSLFPSGSAGLHAFRAAVFFLFCTGCPQVFPHCPQVFHKFSPFVAARTPCHAARVSCHISKSAEYAKSRPFYATSGFLIYAVFTPFQASDCRSSPPSHRRGRTVPCSPSL